VPVPDLVGEGGGALEKLVRGENLDILRRAFAALSIEKRELLILSRFEEMKYADIARLIGVNVPTIKVRVHRALNELRHFFQKESEEMVS
jgi:RNA polymerase sigma-70 factor (ECF subfamily)